LEVLFMVSKLWGLQYLSAPIMAALQRVSILFAVVNGHLFLQEENFVRRMSAALLMILGVIVILT
jgi:uncharacterized membrane protein